MSAGRGRLIGIVTILLLAPVTAELLQAYLGDLGGIGGLIFVDLFFAPLYGGMALLIREVCLRTGRGWSGRLLLAAAFGVSMTAIIDLSLFTTVRDDIDGWDAIVSAASVGGIGWYAAITWVGGHVLMSVAAPSIVAETLARRPGPWLGPVGLGVTVLGFLGVATFIHRDQSSANTVVAGTGEYVVAAAVVIGLVALAFTPLGRPLGDRPGRVPGAGLCLLIGFVAMTAMDFVPLSWLGLGAYVVVLIVGLTLVGRWSRAPGWTDRHLAALTFGALLARTLIGFLSPLPQETTWAEKLTQNFTYLVLVLLLGWALHRRTRVNH